MTKYIVVIPARIGSNRLARKPLLDIAEKPMIVHTYERAIEATSPESVYIATDSEEILEVCDGIGAQSILTSEHCLTGTDRVAEAAKSIDADVYVNLQGDEPMMDPANIRRVIEASIVEPTKIINGWETVQNEEEYRSRSIPKVVMREDGRLLYMSRAPIPGAKNDTFKFARKQICVYSFPRNALQQFSASRRKTPHEQVEDIEILRFLELGWEVQMIHLPGTSLAVDTFEDLARVRSHFETSI